MKFEETSYFTVQYIAAPLRHKPDASLRLIRLVSTDVVYERWFVCDLEVTNITIALKVIAIGKTLIKDSFTDKYIP